MLSNLHQERSIIVDAHVHLHDCFNLKEFFDQASVNLRSAAAVLGKANSYVGVLILTECSNEHYFSKLAVMANTHGTSPLDVDLGRWSLRPTNEPISVLVRGGNDCLVVIAGRQIACSEHLEVLVFGTDRTFQEGCPIDDVLKVASSYELLPVIPWGAGKWFFRRGRLLTKLMDSKKTFGICLGDEGGRPIFWPTPRHLKQARKKGIRVLPGSDPLPFPREVKRVGSFGFWMNGELDFSMPAASIKTHLRDPRVQIFPFGRLENPYWFVRNQIGMQLLKYRRRRTGSHDLESKL